MKSGIQETRLEEQLNQQLQANIESESMNLKSAKNKAFCQHQSGLIK